MKIIDKLKGLIHKLDEPEKPANPSGGQAQVWADESLINAKPSLKTRLLQNKKLLIASAVGFVLLISVGAFALVKISHNSSSSGGSSNNGPASSSQNDSSKTSNSKSTAGSGQTGGSARSSSTSSNAGSATNVAGPIGFVGCSNSRDTVLGYRADGGTKMWVPTTNTYGGGTVVSWQTDAQYFGEFDQFLSNYPTTKVVWWSLCTHQPNKNNETDANNYSAALYIISTLKSKIPGVIIYASALNTYVAPHICQVTGEDGPSRMQSLVDRLVSEDRVKLGPVVGSLLSIYPINVSNGATSSNNQTKSDGCHPNTVGEAHLGQSLINFFGK